MPAKQRELTLFETHPNSSKPNVKKIQLRHFNMAHSVIVDMDVGTILHLHGAEMAKYQAAEQTAVLNKTWLDRLTHAVDMFNDLCQRQERERWHLESLVNEILDESVKLTESELPKRVEIANLRAHNMPDEVRNLRAHNEPEDDDIAVINDDDDVPF